MKSITHLKNGNSVKSRLLIGCIAVLAVIVAAPSANAATTVVDRPLDCSASFAARRDQGFEKAGTHFYKDLNDYVAEGWRLTNVCAADHLVIGDVAVEGAKPSGTAVPATRFISRVKTIVRKHRHGRTISCTSGANVPHFYTSGGRLVQGMGSISCNLSVSMRSTGTLQDSTLTGLRVNDTDASGSPTLSWSGYTQPVYCSSSYSYRSLNFKMERNDPSTGWGGVGGLYSLWAAGGSYGGCP
jgi:hypothetical protein